MEQEKKKKLRSPLARAVQVILDLTEDTDFVCEQMNSTWDGVQWCGAHCEKKDCPDHECCKEWLLRHWNG